MDANRFDAFVRSFTITAPRRAIVGTLLGGRLPTLLTRFGDEDAAARRRRDRQNANKNKKKCKEECAPCERCKRGKCKPRPRQQGKTPHFPRLAGQRLGGHGIGRIPFPRRLAGNTPHAMSIKRGPAGAGRRANRP